MKQKIFSVIVCAVMLICFAGCAKEEALGKIEEEKETEDTITYTDKEIYIHSFECGYLSEYRMLRDILLMIENEEQLSIAEKTYDLGEDALEKMQNTYVAEEFQKMKSEYPIEEYTYLLCYREVSSGGYYLHADKVQIKDARIYFQMDEESYSPSGEEMVTEVMGGFFHMAAIPKEYLDGKQLENVVYPSNTND